MKPPPDDEIAAMFRSHAEALLLYARQWIDAASAEDVVQKAFIRMLACGQRPAEPRAWLFRCVRNEAISEWRSNRRRNRRQRAVASDRGACLPERTSIPIAREPIDRVLPDGQSISPALLQSAENLRLRNAILEKGLSALPLPEMAGQAPPWANPASNPSPNDNPDAIEERGILYRG